MCGPTERSSCIVQRLCRGFKGRQGAQQICISAECRPRRPLMRCSIRRAGQTSLVDLGYSPGYSHVAEPDPGSVTQASRSVQQLTNGRRGRQENLRESLIVRASCEHRQGNSGLRTRQASRSTVPLICSPGGDCRRVRPVEHASHYRPRCSAAHSFIPVLVSLATARRISFDLLVSGGWRIEERCCARRTERVTIVKVGFAKPPVGNTDEPTTKRFVMPCIRQLLSTMPDRSSSAMRVVPM